MPGQEEVWVYRERADCVSSVTGNLVIERLLGTTGAEERASTMRFEALPDCYESALCGDSNITATRRSAPKALIAACKIKFDVAHAATQLRAYAGEDAQYYVEIRRRVNPVFARACGQTR